MVIASWQARTRPIRRRDMLKTCVPSTSRRMWRRTMARPKPASGGEARSMPARQGTRAMAVAEATQNDRMHLWLGKQHGTMRKAKHRGVARNAGGFLLNLIAYNLIRIPKMVAA